MGELVEDLVDDAIPFGLEDLVAAGEIAEQRLPGGYEALGRRGDDTGRATDRLRTGVDGILEVRDYVLDLAAEVADRRLSGCRDEVDRGVGATVPVGVHLTDDGLERRHRLGELGHVSGRHFAGPGG